MSTYKGEIGTISVKSCHEVEWSIGNFCSYTVKDEYYSSKTFRMSDSEWRLRVYPNGETARNSVGWISLELHREGSPEPARNTYGRNSSELHRAPPVGACYSFGVKKVDGTVERILNELTWVFEEDEVGCGYTRFLEWSELLLSKSEMLASNSLTLTCTLWTGKHLERFGSLDTLRHFADLFISRRGCDATIKVMNKEFSVHKWILSARSPVLGTMFQADMKEKRTGIVEIDDCDPKIFKEFLMYLYSGKIEDASCNAFELYKIADKYDVEDLKSYCLLLIMTSLSVENVLDAAVLGSLFDESQLMLKIQTYFNKNYKQIISSSKWDKEFLSEHPAVANELLKCMAKQ